ncbi:unnamed protein product [Cuscuta campestris]|uniref:Uncharacterized protein n=1 Tax=Cuscuta campestris TaxID=132261 RepID=A0A484NPR1_9ASTE|nr:unnamed protein product [Cuscuta campestris]
MKAGRRPQKQEDDKNHWGQVGDELAPDITGESACDSCDESASKCRAENPGGGRGDGREHLQVAGVFLSFGNPLKYEPKDDHQNQHCCNVGTHNAVVSLLRHLIGKI